MIFLSSKKWMFAVLAIALLAAGTGCKKSRTDPFPASGAVSSWEKTSDTRVFAANDLWKYIDGDAEQYISAGVVSVNLRLQIPGPVGGGGGCVHHGRFNRCAQDS